MFAARSIRRFVRSLGCIILALTFLSLQTPSAVNAVTCTYQNPLVERGQDPSVLYRNGVYYLVQSEASGLTIRKSARLSDLGHVPAVPVYQPPSGQEYSNDMWAPELQYLDGHWLIYFAADDAPGHNAAHRIYAIQADTDDPMGTWSFKGKIFDAAADKWAIDASIFDLSGQLYMIWSGWPGDKGDFPQNLYIAHMRDPLTLDSPRVMIATPDQTWENSVQAIEEGPEPFLHNGQVSIIYSADASWTTTYKLGMLVLSGSDPLKAGAWTKHGPVLQGYADSTGAVYGTGHNSQPVASPDETQNWLVYASKTIAADGWNDRAVEMQPFTWNADNTPNFGKAIPAGVALAAPSGEPCGLVSAWPLTSQGDGQGAVAARDSNGTTAAVSGSPQWTSVQAGGALQFNGSTDFLDLGKPLINMNGSFSVSAWVNLSRTDGTFTFASQDGGIVSGFYLGYAPPKQGNLFAFSMGDGRGAQNVSAVSTFSPAADTWYSVVGVRDASTNRIRLYVEWRPAKRGFFCTELVGAGRYDTRSGQAQNAAHRLFRRKVEGCSLLRRRVERFRSERFIRGAGAHFLGDACLKSYNRHDPTSRKSIRK